MFRSCFAFPCMVLACIVCCEVCGQDSAYLRQPTQFEWSNLLNDPQRLRELGLTTEQQAAIRGVGQANAMAIYEAQHSGELSSDEIHSLILELTEQVRPQLEEILLPHQLHRLAQLTNQRLLAHQTRGQPPGSFLIQPHLVRHLRLSDGQERQMRARIEELEKQLSQVQEGVNQRVKLQADRIHSQLLRQLTADQRRQVREIIGERFEFRGPIAEGAIHQAQEFPKTSKPHWVGQGLSPLLRVWPPQKLDTPLPDLAAWALLELTGVEAEIQLVQRQRERLREFEESYKVVKNWPVIWADHPHREQEMHNAIGFGLSVTIYPETDEIELETEHRERLGQIRAILLTHQWRRLEQLHAQWLIKVANYDVDLLHPDWKRLLDLDDAQQDFIRQQRQDFEAERTRLLEEHRLESANLRQKAIEDLLGLLSEEQQERLTWLLGEWVHL